MDPFSAVSEELAEIHGEISDIFRALSNGFQKLEKVKDSNRQSRQLEELTEKMRECKRLIKEFDRKAKDLESRNDPDTNKMLNEKKQSMIKELNSYVALKKQYASNLENKRIDLFDGGTEGYGEDNVLLASNMTNQQLVDSGNRMMDETDQAIERSKKTVQDTVNVGTEAAAALKAQVATDKCIMALLFLIVVGVIAIIIVKLVNPNNKDIRDIPGLAPPAMTRKLLWSAS
nr:putative plant snare 11 [Quercus suber]